MFVALLQTTERKIAGVRRVLEGNEHFRALIASDAGKALDHLVSLNAKYPETTDWRQHESSASILLLYAVFERFVETLLSDYLSTLPQLICFDKLPEAVRLRYPDRIGRLLTSLDQRRYRGVDVKALVGGYVDGLRGVTPYRLDPKPLLMHSENFRMPTITAIFQDCGLDGVESWLANDVRLEKFLKEHCAEGATATTELAKFVEFRNDAAHGVPYTLPSVGEMSDMCDFVGLLCASLHDFVVKCVLNVRLGIGRAVKLSEAKELIKDGRVAIGSFENTTVSVGDVLYFITAHACTTTTVTSIQLDDDSKESVTVVAATELGLGLSTRVKKDSHVIALVEPVPAAAAAAVG